jgi:uncharacterized tellurite resistance protein B-like protein
MSGKKRKIKCIQISSSSSKKYKLQKLDHKEEKEEQKEQEEDVYYIFSHMLLLPMELQLLIMNYMFTTPMQWITYFQLWCQFNHLSLAQLQMKAHDQQQHYNTWKICEAFEKKYTWPLIPYMQFMQICHWTHTHLHKPSFHTICSHCGSLTCMALPLCSPMKTHQSNLQRYEVKRKYGLTRDDQEHLSSWIVSESDEALPLALKIHDGWSNMIEHLQQQYELECLQQQESYRREKRTVQYLAKYYYQIKNEQIQHYIMEMYEHQYHTRPSHALTQMKTTMHLIYYLNYLVPDWFHSFAPSKKSFHHYLSDQAAYWLGYTDHSNYLPHPYMKPYATRLQVLHEQLKIHHLEPHPKCAHWYFDFIFYFSEYDNDNDNNIDFIISMTARYTEKDKRLQFFEHMWDFYENDPEYHLSPIIFERLKREWCHAAIHKQNQTFTTSMDEVQMAQKLTYYLVHKNKQTDLSTTKTVLDHSGIARSSEPTDLDEEFYEDE